MGEGRRRRQPGEDGVRESLRCLRHEDLPLAGKRGVLFQQALHTYRYMYMYVQVVSNADLSN